MGLPDNRLPATLTDHVAGIDPELAAHVRQDAADLMRRGFGPGFLKLEELPTAFFDLAQRRLDRLIAAEAAKRGLSHNAMAAELRATSRDRIEAEFRKLAEVYHLLLSFEIGGGKIFRVAAGLAERLLATRIDVPSEALRLPFRSFMLVFDDDASFAAFHSGRPFGRAPAAGALSSIVVDIEHPEGRRVMTVSTHTRGKHAHGRIHRSMRYDEGTLEAMLATSWSDDPAADRAAAALAFNRLVLNSVLYIGSQDARVGAEIRAPQPRDRLTYSGRKHAVIGAGLPPLRSGGSGRATAGAPSPAPASASISRQLVSGHWKHQPHGTGRSLRKLLWIEPYMRGPDYAEVVNRARLVR